jgi:Leucine-rich repeat (LRR) protein
MQDFRVSAGVLDLSSRELGSIPLNLAQSLNARSVVVLRAQNNRLKRLAHLGEFKSLLRINLCDNNIESIDEIMGELSEFGRLNDLLLRNNRIRCLTPSICRLRNLEMLDLKGNSIE